MARIVPTLDSIQYDGTNGTYIYETWLNSMIHFISDNGTTFVFQDGEYTTFNVAIGDWLIRHPDTYNFPDVRTNAEYVSMYTELPQ